MCIRDSINAEYGDVGQNACPELNKINQRLDDLEQDVYELAQPRIAPAAAAPAAAAPAATLLKKKKREPPATLDELELDQVLEAQMQPSCQDELDEMYESDDSLETQECFA
eukprot:TRINITY_DN483_c0_g1_i6.p2 TRINITY_DN483_c0_g1~~TRINITY_DN483_c0_g1_i6.p2  ORF type:complete len:111 (+),score=37.64 TRINITY_DN483_c0_g1_i6:120-452(+)